MQRKFAKRVISFILFFTIIFSVIVYIPVTVNAKGEWGGTGTEQDPYTISDKDGLLKLATEVNNGTLDTSGKYYKLTANIDLKGYDWLPIGKEYDYPFKGIFDGENHTIYNLSITNNNINFVGLFGLSLGSISNIILENMQISLNNPSRGSSPYSLGIGGICGSISSYMYSVTITRCVVKGKIDIINLDDYIDVGGITGNGIVSNCDNFADINISSNNDCGNTLHCGGITGYGDVANNINYGNITATAGGFLYCGGIIGDGESEYCINYGNIQGNVTNCTAYNTFAYNCNVGGIIGATARNDNNNLVNMGNITATAYNGTSAAGGIIGFLGYFSSGKMENCYNGASEISSYTHQKNNSTNQFEIVSANAGRICGRQTGSASNPLLELYSIGTTLVNGAVPTQGITKTEINGETVSKDFINKEIERIKKVISPKSGLNTNNADTAIPVISIVDEVTSFVKIFKFVNIAKRQAENNYRNEYISPGKYRYNATGKDWCMDFAVWCAEQAGIPKISSEITSTPFIYNTRSCPTAYNWYKNQKRIYTTPKVGALVFFRSDYYDNGNIYKSNMGHVGIVVGIDKDKNTIDVVEGNYTPKNETEPRVVKRTYTNMGYCYPYGNSKVYIGGYAYLD